MEQAFSLALRGSQPDKGCLCLFLFFFSLPFLLFSYKKRHTLMQSIASQISEGKFKTSLCLPECSCLNIHLGGRIATVAEIGSNEVIRRTKWTICKA